MQLTPKFIIIIHGLAGSCNRMTSQELINFPDWCWPSRTQSFLISGIWIATCNINRGKMTQESSFYITLLSVTYDEL